MKKRWHVKVYMSPILQDEPEEYDIEKFSELDSLFDEYGTYWYSIRSVEVHHNYEDGHPAGFKAGPDGGPKGGWHRGKKPGDT